MHTTRDYFRDPPHGVLTQFLVRTQVEHEAPKREANPELCFTSLETMPNPRTLPTIMVFNSTWQMACMMPQKSVPE